MIKTAIELQEPLTYIFRNTMNKEYKKIFPTSVEWLTLQQLEKLFLVLVKPTLRLQSEYYTNINKALLFVYQIYNQLEGLITDFESEAQEEPDLVSYLLYNILIIIFTNI
jgi:hypothetical protein